jgi:hypothetical protein
VIYYWHKTEGPEEHYTERCTLGTLLARFKNTIKNGVISWHTNGEAEEHYKERFNILAHYWKG